MIGYDESEQLDVEPARYFVRVTKREKRACRRCSTLTAAPLAERIVDKGLASDAVVINTVVAKYCDHLPLYRQAVMMEREAGNDIQLPDLRRGLENPARTKWRRRASTLGESVRSLGRQRRLS